MAASLLRQRYQGVPFVSSRPGGLLQEHANMLVERCCLLEVWKCPLFVRTIRLAPAIPACRAPMLLCTCGRVGEPRCCPHHPAHYSFPYARNTRAVSWPFMMQ